jgi:hypothetical protein
MVAFKEDGEGNPGKGDPDDDHDYGCYCLFYGKTNKKQCKTYADSKLVLLVAKNGITVAIVILNSVLKIVNITLINTIGYSYNSDVISTTVVAVFIS